MSKSVTVGTVKIRLASLDGVNVVEVEGPSSATRELADSALRLWRFLVRPEKAPLP